MKIVRRVAEQQRISLPVLPYLFPPSGWLSHFSGFSMMSTSIAPMNMIVPVQFIYI